MMHIADNHDALLDYLYDEGDPAERLKIAKHLQECASCSVAVLEFKTVRGMLNEWKSPSAQLGFRIVQEPAAAPGSSASPAWWSGRSWTSRLRRMPYSSGLAQAAAAVLLFAGGMAASQIRVDYHDGALTLRSQSAPPQAGPARTSSIPLPAEAPVATGMGLVPVATAVEPAASANRGGDETVEQLLQRVRSMIEQSEARQQRELALRLSQVANEVETQHRADLLRMQQNFGQLEIETGAQINQQQQLMDYLVRTSGGPK